MEKLHVKWQLDAHIEQMSKEKNEYLYKIVQDVKKLMSNKSNPASFIMLPEQQREIDACKHLVNQLEKYKPELIVVIGIGGSSNGVSAIYHALNIQTSSIPMLFIETLDSSNLRQQYEKIQSNLDQKKYVIACVITKSGTTLETTLNAAMVLQKFDEHPNFLPCIITDEGSPLEKIAHEQSYPLALINPAIGGRFSIFSAVGQVPLRLAGISVDELLTGACTANAHINDAVRIASNLYNYYLEGYAIHDFFYFDGCLAELGVWVRQLFAESLGKLRQGESTYDRIGILPTVSIGTQDLHSMFQLYMAGPHNRVTSFVMLNHEYQPEIVSLHKKFEKQLAYVDGKSVSYVLSAIIKGVKYAYKQQKLPYYIVTFSSLSAQSIGEYMQMYMVATVYLGYLLDINPFDQPQVELYKTRTREILHI